MNWTAVASLIAALAAAAGVVFTGLSVQTTRAQAALTEQGQVTDRYGKAVDQLDRTGPEHLQARLGAIYALERLARDSPRDQPTIIEVLSAFIRTTTPQATPTLEADQLPASTCPRQAVAPDIQAALTVLGRRDTTHDQTTRIDLHSTCLAKADLRDLNLSGANLGGAYFSGAYLYRADLSGANLVRADISGAFIGFANLSGAWLNDANLGDANFLNANLTRAYLTDANLSGANLTNANLTGTNLLNANLTNAELGIADLSGADLSGADLSGANLTLVDFTNANLSGAVHDRNTVVTGVLISSDTKGVWW